jgi:hypothetical protein
MKLTKPPGPRKPRVKICGKVVEVSPLELKKIMAIDQKWVADVRKKQFRDSLK